MQNPKNPCSDADTGEGLLLPTELRIQALSPSHLTLLSPSETPPRFFTTAWKKKGVDLPVFNCSSHLIGRGPEIFVAQDILHGTEGATSFSWWRRGGNTFISPPDPGPSLRAHLWLFLSEDALVLPSTSCALQKSDVTKSDWITAILCCESLQCLPEKGKASSVSLHGSDHPVHHWDHWPVLKSFTQIQMNSICPFAASSPASPDWIPVTFLLLSQLLGLFYLLQFKTWWGCGSEAAGSSQQSWMTAELRRKARSFLAVNNEYSKIFLDYRKKGKKRDKSWPCFFNWIRRLQLERRGMFVLKTIKLNKHTSFYNYHS